MFCEAQLKSCADADPAARNARYPTTANTNAILIFIPEFSLSVCLACPPSSLTNSTRLRCRIPRQAFRV